MSALPPKADVTPSDRDVRFTPESGHSQALSGCPLCANIADMDPFHSINSSARPISVFGMERPSALAVLSLMIP
jgi:hypothetical protein